MRVAAVLGVLVVLVACPAQRPTQQRAVTPRGRLADGDEPSPVRPETAMPRFGLHALDDLVAWPLTRAPSFEPHFDVFARPWTAICERRGALPDDVLAYAELWCRYRANRHLDLVTELGRLKPRTAKLSDAIVDDQVVLIADSMTGKRAVDWLGATGLLDRRPTLIAVYLELGRVDEARAVFATQPAFVGCEYDLYKVLLDFSPTGADELARHAEPNDGPGSCRTHAARLTCLWAMAQHRALDDEPADDLPERCDGTAPIGPDEPRVAAIAALALWSSVREPQRSNFTWLRIATMAEAASPIVGFAEVAVDALVEVHRPCDAKTQVDVSAIARRLLVRKDLDGARITTLERLVTAPCR